MEPIPDHWPPDDAPTPIRRVAPLFPLPKIFLYPDSLMPMHIFESRYKQMVEDLLDRPGWLVMCAIVGGHEGEAMAAPPVYPIGGLGEIVKHSRLADGRFLITLAGLARVHVREVESDRLYRKVEFEAVHEVQPEQAESVELCDELRKAILESSQSFLNLPSNLPPSTLTDLLIQNLDMPVDDLQQTYAEPGIARRARMALRIHQAD